VRATICALSAARVSLRLLVVGALLWPPANGPVREAPDRAAGPELALSPPLSLQAPGLSAHFSSRGVELRADATWSFQLDGPPSTPRADGDRVVLSRGPHLDEWYRPARHGLEQGFTVKQLPEGDLLLSGEVNLAAKRIPGGLDFGRFHYTALHVHDAAGRELPSSIEWEPERRVLGLKVAAAALRGARLPITVDPLLTAVAWSADPVNQGQAEFFVVAGVGDVDGDGFEDAVVGAPRWSVQATAEGRVSLYRGSAAGPTLPPLTLDPTDQNEANFGFACAGLGDVNGDGRADVAIGAPGWDSGAGANEGRAYVYLGHSSGLAPSPTILQPPNQANAGFGFSVAGAGDVNGDGFADVLVGARYWNGAVVAEGRAYLFLGGAGGVSATPAWSEAPANQNAYFSESLASAGDVNGDGYADVLIGTGRWDGSGQDEGRAWLYLGGPGGLATSPVWTADPTDQALSYFGESVAGLGDVNGDGRSDVAVGALEFDTVSFAGEGRVYVYHGTATGLTAAPVLTLDPMDEVDGRFGSALSGGDVNGDGYGDLQVTGIGYDEGSVNHGRAFSFLGDPLGLSTASSWTVDPGEQSGELFGLRVSASDLNGDGAKDVLVGSQRDAEAFREGRAYLFLGNASGAAAAPTLTRDPTDMGNSLFANRLAVGDVNGDGLDDLLTGARWYDAQAVDEGVAYLFLGDSAGLGAAPSWTLHPTDEARALFGDGVALGDLNGDGFADALIGARDWSSAAFSHEGRVYLYPGSATGLAAAPSWTADPADQQGSGFGELTALADVNGDGFPDALVTATSFDSATFSNEGRAYLFLGGPGGFSAAPVWTADPADTISAFFGRALAADDFNGDGYADVAIAASYWSQGASISNGRVWLYLGGPDGLSAAPAWTADPTDQANSFFGDALSSAGDVNGDGFADLLVGAPSWDGNFLNEGRVWLYLGNAGGLQPTAVWSLEPCDATGCGFGGGVGGVGDVNGDGYADVFVGADDFTGQASREGRGFLYLGSASGLPAAFSASSDPTNVANAGFGRSAVAGDFNGDGFSDQAIGAPSWNVEEGRLFVYLGGDLGVSGAPRALAQLSGAPPMPLGEGSRATLGDVRLRGRTGTEGTLGGRVRLEVELKRVGAPFNGAGTLTSSPVIAGEIAEVRFSALAPGGYHWRARTVHALSSGRGRWASFGANSESQPDFRVPGPFGLAFFSAPTGGVAGQPLSATAVEVLDERSARFAGASPRISIVLTGGPGGATLTGGAPQIPTGGLAGFNGLTVDRVGSGYRLEARALGLAPVVTDPFSITAGPPAAISFVQQPVDAVAGQALAPVRVQLLDVAGNAAEGTVTLQLEVNPTSALLGGTRERAVTTGVADFLDLSVDLPGAGYELRASSGTLSALSVPFNVDAAPGSARPPRVKILADATRGEGSLDPRLRCDCAAGSSPIVAYRWEAGGAAFSSSPEPARSFGPGRHWVRLTVVDDAGLTAFDELELVITREGREPPACRALASPAVGAAPLTVSFSALLTPTAGPIVETFWILDGERIGAESFTRVLGPPGRYAALLVAADAEGLECRALAEVIAHAGAPARGLPPWILTVPSQEADCALPYRYGETEGPAAAGPRPVSWSARAPEGLEIDAATAAVSWIPYREQEGARSVTLIASNAYGETAQSYEVQVRCRPRRLTVGCGCSATELGWAPLVGLVLVGALAARRTRVRRDSLG
jgi:hypothetical protein